jgi:hypothetical protein
MLSITGSLAILPVLVCLSLIFLPQRWLSKDFSFSKVVKSTPILLILGLIVVVTGLVSKVGYELTYSLLTERPLMLIETVVLRASSSFASGVVSSAVLLSDPFYSAVLDAAVDTFSYRVSLLNPLALSSSGEYLNTINRINYLNVSVSHSLDRAGASPGLLASFIYLPGSIFTVYLIPIYLITINYLESYRLDDDVNSRVIVVLAFLLFVLPLFESPFSILNILDPVAITFYILFLLPKFRLIYDA